MELKLWLLSHTCLLLMISSVTLGTQKEIFSLFKEMTALLSKQEEKRSFHPFPKLDAPTSSDRVAIVGAGPSGLHMAYELVKRGVKKITIFEESDVVGGKSHTEESYDGKVKHDMGTCYTTGDYVALFKLIDELKIDIHKIRLPASTVRSPKTGIITDYVHYNLFYLHKLYPTKTAAELVLELYKVMLRYMKKHRELFGSYDHELMPQPSDVMMKEELNVTFDQFLVKNDMVALRQVFVAAHTIMGYGQLDEISALYGLMWMTPRFVYDIVSGTLKLPNKMYIFREGFQYIWTNVAAHLKRQGVKIRLNACVVKVYHRCKKAKPFGVIYRAGRRKLRQRYDWMIWSPSLQIAKKVIKGFKRNFPEFHAASKKMTPQFLTTTLIKVRNDSWPYVDYWMDNVNGDRSKSTVWADRYSALAKNVTITTETDDHSPIIVSYIFGPQRPSRAQVKSIYRHHYKKYNPSFESKPHIWSYFPRFSVKDMANGILWKLFRKQGKKKAWFIGSSVSFESVKSVMEYNLLMLRNLITQ